MMARRSVLVALLWLAVVVAGVDFVRELVPAFSRPSHGFVAYYTASRLLAAGADPALNYDVDWFIAQIARFQPDASDVHINPPPTNVLLLPLVGLDYVGARRVWSTLSLLTMLLVVGWWLWRWNWRGAWMPAFLLLTLLFQPIRANFHLGQIYVLLLGLFTAAWVAYRQWRAGWLGALLAVAGVMKLAGAFVWLLLLCQRRWRALLAGGVAAVVLLLLTWPGWPAWEAFLTLLRGLSQQPERAVTAYQTWLSWTRHLFTADAQWNPLPVARLPQLGNALYLAGAGLLVGVTAWFAWKMPASPTKAAREITDQDLLFAAGVILGLILSPLALDYHYALLLLPAFILCQWARQQSDWRVWLLLLLALILIAADLPYRSPRLAAGWWALLAYPKLVGGLLLWALCLQQSTESRPLPPVNDQPPTANRQRPTTNHQATDRKQLRTFLRMVTDRLPAHFR
ncbi:MAG: DUF2029 domain-containing protein [Ardenticatenales bacterium]|nr:DUF2029 domain-containing protein [Ardenticatenales bacterium]